MDNFLREFDMKILLGMIAKGKDAEDVRRYARARYKDEEITHGDLEEIDRLLDERDTPVEETNDEIVEESFEENIVE